MVTEWQLCALDRYNHLSAKICRIGSVSVCTTTSITGPLLYVCIYSHKQDSYGDTPLHDAIAKDFRSIIEILVMVPNIDFTQQNHRGFNLLHHAALKGNKLWVMIISKTSWKLFWKHSDWSRCCTNSKWEYLIVGKTLAFGINEY